MPSTYPAKLRVWASVVSQGHVATAASGVMVNAAQEIEQLEKELAWSHEQTRERQEHADRLAERNKELEAALMKIAEEGSKALVSTWETPAESVRQDLAHLWARLAICVDDAEEALGEEKDD